MLRSAALALLLVVSGLAPATMARAADDPAVPITEAHRLLDEGKRLFAIKAFREAADLFARAYAADPKLTLALYNQAFALRKAGLVEQARDAYQSFLAVDQSDLDALWGLAECER